MATPYVPFNPGTVTVSGSDITGTGTNFTVYEPFDFLMIDGAGPVMLETITDATHATAVFAPGDVAGKAYRWVPMADVTKALTLYSGLSAAMTSGNVPALGQLVGAPDKLPFFTGSGTMDLADFKASARSLLALAAAANKLPYFTDGNTAALTDLTAFARTLLDDANAPTALQTLGALGNISAPDGTSDLNNFVVPGLYPCHANTSAAAGLNFPVPLAGMLEVKISFLGGPQVYQEYRTYDGTQAFYRTRSSATNWTAWKALIVGASANGISLASAADYSAMRALLSVPAVGDFGIGSVTGIIPPGADMNSLVTGGLYYQNSGNVLNGPNSNARVYLVFPDNVAGGRCVQLSVGTIGNDDLWIRSQTNGVWNAWVRVTNEYGSNANGQYVKMSDGTMIQWSNGLTVPYYNSSLIRGEFTLPAAFIDSNYTVVASLPSPEASYVNCVSTDIASISVNTQFADHTIIIIRRSTSSPSFASNASITGVVQMAIGRWRL